MLPSFNRGNNLAIVTPFNKSWISFIPHDVRSSSILCHFCILMYNLLVTFVHVLSKHVFGSTFYAILSCFCLASICVWY